MIMSHNGRCVLGTVLDSYTVYSVAVHTIIIQCSLPVTVDCGASATKCDTH